MNRLVFWICFLLTGPLVFFCLSKSGAAGSSHTPQKPVLYGLSVRSEPAPALVFVNGRFVGQTSVAEPIEITLSESDVQIRVSEAGYLDGIHELKLEAGQSTAVRVQLETQKGKWSPPTFPVKIAVGQPLRGMIGKDGKGPVFVVDEPETPHRMFVGLSNRLRYKVKDSEGKPVLVESLEDRPAGTPGDSFHHFFGRAKGPYTIEVTGAPGPFSIRYVKGLPPLAKTNNPILKGRREPPR